MYRRLKEEMKENISVEQSKGKEEAIVENVTQMVIRMINDQEKNQIEKKKSIVVFGVPESKGEVAYARQREDTDWCHDLLKKSLKVDTSEYEFDKVIRLGKRNEAQMQSNKPRPILIRLKDEEQKWAILRKAKNLKDERRPH